jgi:hypothetical protein
MYWILLDLTEIEINKLIDLINENEVEYSYNEDLNVIRDKLIKYFNEKYK